MSDQRTSSDETKIAFRNCRNRELRFGQRSSRIPAFAGGCGTSRRILIRNGMTAAANLLPARSCCWLAEPTATLRPDHAAEDCAQGEPTVLLDELQLQDDFLHRGVPSETHHQHGTRAGAQVLMPEELFTQRVVTLRVGSVSGRWATSVQSYANLSALNALTS